MTNPSLRRLEQCLYQLEPARFKINKIPVIDVLQNISPYGLCHNSRITFKSSRKFFYHETPQVQCHLWAYLSRRAKSSDISLEKFQHGTRKKYGRLKTLRELRLETIYNATLIKAGIRALKTLKASILYLLYNRLCCLHL